MCQMFADMMLYVCLISALSTVNIDCVIRQEEKAVKQMKYFCSILIDYVNAFFFYQGTPQDKHQTGLGLLVLILNRLVSYKKTYQPATDCHQLGLVDNSKTTDF